MRPLIISENCICYKQVQAPTPRGSGWSVHSLRYDGTCGEAPYFTPLVAYWFKLSYLPVPGLPNTQISRGNPGPIPTAQRVRVFRHENSGCQDYKWLLERWKELFRKDFSVRLRPSSSIHYF
jgi:hypothetical protein